MANKKHLAMLKKGVEAWNKWREKNPDTRPDLREANLSGVNLNWADLSRAVLDGADLGMTVLSEANLSGANLNRTDLTCAIINQADLSEAKLIGAGLVGTTLLNTDLRGADLTGSYVYGVSAWGLSLDRTTQQNLVITSPGDESRATSSNALFMNGLLVCAARFLASAALCRYSSDRDDMQGERWKDASVPQITEPGRQVRRWSVGHDALGLALWHVPARRSA